MRLRHALPAGLLDAGFASLATFGIGLYAVHSLSLLEFGSYALFFSAFLLAAVVPTQLVLAPAEFATVSASTVRIGRLSVLWQTSRLGTPVAVMAAVTVTTAAGLSAQAQPHVVWALAVTTAACSVVSPIQDHVRRVLHSAGLSWHAACMSAVQLCCIIAALAVFEKVGILAIWRPFSALAVANGVSLAVGVTFVRRRLQAPTLPRYHIGHLMNSGRWLLLLETATAGAVFGSSVIVTRLASATALGQAEAARIVAHPLSVLTIGLSSALGPRSIEAGATRSRDAARRIALPFTMLLVGAGLLYGAATAVAWVGNPLSALVPRAYTMTGLVPLMIIAYVLLGLPLTARAELIGAGRERTLPRVGLLAGALELVAAISAVWIGAFAWPLGFIIFGVVLSLGYQGHRRAIYADGPTIIGKAIASQPARGCRDQPRDLRQLFHWKP